MSGILDRFADVRSAEPGRLLVHLPGRDAGRSASDIWRDHELLAGQIHACGVRPNQLVVSGASNEPSGVALFLACRALDVTLLAVDPGTTPHELTELGDRFQAAALALPAGAGSALTRDSASGTDVAGLTLVVRDLGVARTYPGVALLKLSSGSTGTPKTAVATDAQLARDGSQIIRGMGIGPDDTQIAAIPLSHSYGFSVLVMPLLLQGTPIVLRESFVPQQLPADARTFDARRFPGVPFMFQYFLDHPPGGGWPRTLQQLVSAGARLPADTVRQFHDRYGVKIHTFYGTTETGGIAFDDEPAPAEDGVIGRPLPGVTISLETDADLPAGTGRVHVRSGAVADGYLDCPGEGFENGGFLTGDYGTVDAAGRLTLTGRVSSFVNIAGRKVQPDEVEAVLRSMPHVRDARVLSAPDARRGQQIAACVVADTPMTLFEVRRFCAVHLASHKVPRIVVFLDAIPLTARGKTDRAALDGRAESL